MELFDKMPFVLFFSSFFVLLPFSFFHLLRFNLAFLVVSFSLQMMGMLKRMEMEFAEERNKKPQDFYFILDKKLFSHFPVLLM
jgi:hypothetical protein